MTSPPRRPALGPLVAPLINKAADLQVAASSKAAELLERSYSRAKELHVPETVRTAVVTGFRGAVNAVEDLLARETAGGSAPETEAKARSAALPLPDYDSQSLASVRARLGRLSLAELEELRGHEAGHGARPEFLKTLDNRIAKVRAGAAKPGGSENSRTRKPAPPAGA